ncbi:HD domain-containing phosphohydrolase [Halomonas sp. YLGW01]|uniref:HD domain-containing phosphohydrolase n=1 Tax=Halomonas sp. YLGW01 TaxID=2773308 RepID=UPI00177DFC9A|nr:HD domain-containing phosphohydrolase [Halomonas sp. YLGW01]
MAPASDAFTPVESFRECQELLDCLMQAGGASLQLEQGEHQHPLPVLVADMVPGEWLKLDISAIREVAGRLKRGEAFRLLGQAPGKMLRTPPLVVSECREVEGRLECAVAYPDAMEVLQRRDSFRAELRLNMEVAVTLQGGGLKGWLRNLSVDGAQVELPLAAASQLAADTALLTLEMVFPDGTHFAINATLRHDRPLVERQLIQAGFQFGPRNAQQERELWYFVREIEREAARYEEEDAHPRAPSALFKPRPGQPADGHEAVSYATPMTQRLARLSGYLDSQLLALKQGRGVEAQALSRQADRLLALLDEDREALLFASACLPPTSSLVHHGLNVAIRLADLVGRQRMPQEVRKALVASAMVHDLGKALLPEELRQARQLDDDQYRAIQAHVGWIHERLAGCGWLSEAVTRAVVTGANERLDGSGYPEGLAGDRLHELSRAMGVVDVVDAMGRARSDREGWTLEAIYRHLLSHPGRFDQTWVKRYVRHFGVMPVGSLVRFASGHLGWVLSLDDQGAIRRVWLTDAVALPHREMGERLEAAELARLGRPVETLRVPLP